MDSTIKLVFATRNTFKIDEINRAVPARYTITSMADAGCDDDLPETSFTTAGNSMQKAQYFYDRFKIDCFAEDTSLEIEALDGRPGIYSARYAGPAKSFDDNVNKVLEEMQGLENRTALFRTVIGLIFRGQHHIFEGIVTGTILTEKRGNGGFGYDPIFLPAGYDTTYAEMGAEKNSMSHRYLAVKKLIEFLDKQ